MSRPLFRILSPEGEKLIHEKGLEILQEVGIRVSDESMLSRLKDAGADVDMTAGRVRFRREWMMTMIDGAPSRFVLYSRDGGNDLDLGGENVYFGNGGRVFRILDMGTRGYRSTMLRDIAHTATLVERLENIDFYIIACQAYDVEPESYHLNDFYHTFNHTKKHVMGGCTDLQGVMQMNEIAVAIAGSAGKLRERPFVSVITNPISPLTFEEKTLSILDFACSRGIPVTCAPAPISGATAPATLAGTLAQMHAEALAGVAITQVISAGSRVLYGAVPTTMDLRNVEFTLGSVEMSMMNAAAIQLAKLCRLPVYGSAGVTESKQPDIQAGTEKTFSNLMTALAGGDCIHLAAGMLDSGNSISYEQYVIDDEIIGMVRRVMDGIRIDEATLGFDVIEKVGPGGNYITEDHTVEHMMNEFFYPGLAVRSLFDVWEKKGRPSMLSRANERVREILENGSEGLLSSELIERIVKDFPGIQEL